MKKILIFLLNAVLGVLFIVLFNFVFSKINLYIGLNPVSTAIIAMLGTPGVIVLIVSACLL